ncbi:MAG: tryptophan--tRNA ligase [Candidatus Bathyarchaeia archaeon]
MSKKEKAKFIVTPWEVRGEVDYEKLVKKFGTQPIDDKLLMRIKRHTGGLHLFLRRGIFFSHRDLDWILDMYEKGEGFFLYTGRGPSGHTHLGHLIPWIFTKYLQDAFGAELYFQMTDDEKFLVKRELTIDDVTGFSYENALDVIACGFDPKKTFIFSDFGYAKTIYKLAVQVARHVTFSTAKAVFGFTGESNIGIVFFPAIQAVPCFLPSVLKGRNIPCLIPAAIDQDPYWRGVARYVAPKLGFYKPAQIHCKFLPGLGPGGKMSASEPQTSIFTTDRREEIEAKIMNAFTGGQPTLREQREKGGSPSVCSIFQYYYFLFEDDDDRLRKIYEDCKRGEIFCGECKKRLSERVVKFIEEHQERREKAKSKLEDFILRD